MSRLTRDGTAELVSRDQILRHERGQGNIHTGNLTRLIHTLAICVTIHTYIYACAPAANRSYLTTVCVLVVLFLGGCRFFRAFCIITVESTLYVFSFRMVFLYLVIHRLDFDIGLCENSINQSY